MRQTVPARYEVPPQSTWDAANVFDSDRAWDEAVEQLSAMIPGLADFHGKLGASPARLADWLERADRLRNSADRIYLYASMLHNVDTANQTATAMRDRAIGLATRVTAALAFANPEIVQIGWDRLRSWVEQEPRLWIYAKRFDELERLQAHVRSAEVEELLGQVRDPFTSAAEIHATLADADLQFVPAETRGGDQIDVAQGTIAALLTNPDREVRRTAWESYADAHLATRHTMANCLATGVKQDVFFARARGYQSSLEAALTPNHIPVTVFQNLIDTFRRNLATWHRYWALRRRALGYDTLHAYDVKAPLTTAMPAVPFDQAIEWISAGMAPLGEEYVSTMRRGLTQERWVDVYPNKGKRLGAYSHGVPGTHPYILMSYNDDIFSMSTLAHELGHSMHSFLSWREQPLIYSGYSLFIAEVASNFNQALVRAHLLEQNSDLDFQIAVIEEAMSNFHRYFFVMPTLARFELEIHERVERGEGLSAEMLITLMSDLFREGYGSEVELDTDRTGITWAQFSTHLYSNFYVYQYATGISAANTLAKGIIENRRDAVDNYLAFLKAGSSLYPLDALKLAGVDMQSAEPVEEAFAVLASMVDRLEALVGSR